MDSKSILVYFRIRKENDKDNGRENKEKETKEYSTQFKKKKYTQSA